VDFDYVHGWSEVWISNGLAITATAIDAAMGSPERAKRADPGVPDALYPLMVAGSSLV
jgi:hypothetical protein